jgi:phage baseplate assembly protein gpV
MQVVGVAAGTGKGLVALPDVDDLVLVVLIAGDPAQGVVLGGLHGSSGPFDAGVVGASVKRYTLATPGGHRIRLDDDAGHVRVEDASGGVVELSDQRIALTDASGNEVEMTPDRVRIHSASELVIEAPGNTVRIIGSAVDFETG